MLRSTIAAATILAGCASDHLTAQRQGEPPPLSPLCTIGRAEPCACPDGSEGAQECVEPGVYADCLCEGRAEPDAAAPDAQGGPDPVEDGGTPDPGDDGDPWQPEPPEDAGSPDAAEPSLFWAACDAPMTQCAERTEPDLYCQDFYQAIGGEREEAVRCSFSCGCSFTGCQNERCTALGGRCAQLAPQIFGAFCVLSAE